MDPDGRSDTTTIIGMSIDLYELNNPVQRNNATRVSYFTGNFTTTDVQMNNIAKNIRTINVMTLGFGSILLTPLARNFENLGTNYLVEDFDYIKSAENEINRLSFLIKEYSYDPGFVSFLNDEKSLLEWELCENKYNMFMLWDGLNDGLIDENQITNDKLTQYMKLYPNLVQRFDTEGNNNPQKMINYFSAYYDYCKYMHQEDRFIKFIENMNRSYVNE